jgi:hypothetical protein
MMRRNRYNRTLGPRESAERFEKVWRSQNIVDLLGSDLVIELALDSNSSYGSPTKRLFEKVIEDAHITRSCTEFLQDVFNTYIGYGRSPVRFINLSKLGIDTKRGRYGIFDPGENLEAIERGLLDIHDCTIKSYVIPQLREQEKELNRRWNRDLDERYG